MRHATSGSFKPGHTPWFVERGVPGPGFKPGNPKPIGAGSFKPGNKEGRKSRLPLSPYIGNGGYLTINVNGTREAVHKWVMMTVLGRCLDRRETVHHIDGNKLNNHISNLYLCQSNGHHNKIHGQVESIMFDLVKAGKIIFQEGKYVSLYS